MDSFSAEITDDFPGRETYVKELNQLFGHRDHSFPSSVFVCGASGTGKTSVLLKFFEHVSVRYAYIDCIENYTAKIFYETIINELQGHKLTSSNNFQSYAHCDSAEDFLDALNALDTKQSFAIVLKNFNRLCEMDANVLPILMRLDTMAPALNISCIIVGSKSKKNHIAKLGLVPTIDLHCEQYSKGDLLKILLLQIDFLKQTMQRVIDEGDTDPDIKQRQTNVLSGLDDDFFVGYFNMFMDTFYSICRNAKELQYLSYANFTIYCKPVIDGEIRSTDLRKLYKNMELPFKTAINSIYCRVEQTAIQMNKENGGAISQHSAANSELQQMELPFYTKFLLLSSYLASHNDAKVDKRLFVKHHGKQRKRLQNLRANAVMSEKLSTQIGPKSFTIDRMMAIFYAINEDKVPLTSDLLTQISNLVRLKYLTFVSGENNIIDGSARLQCNVTLNFISMVGKQVGFNIRQYLFDFM